MFKRLWYFLHPGLPQRYSAEVVNSRLINEVRVVHQDSNPGTYSLLIKFSQPVGEGNTDRIWALNFINDHGQLTSQYEVYPGEDTAYLNFGNEPLNKFKITLLDSDGQVMERANVRVAKEG